MNRLLTSCLLFAIIAGAEAQLVNGNLRNGEFRSYTNAVAAAGGGSTQIAADDFNRADGVLGANWTFITAESDFGIVGNQIAPNNLGNDATMYWLGAGSFTADQYSQATIKTLTGGTVNGGDGGGLAVRCSAVARTYYRVIVNAAATGNTEIAVMSAGSYSFLARATVAWSANDVILFQAVGTALTVKKNGSTVLSTTDSAIATGKPGVSYSSAISGFALDDWSSGTIP